MEHVHVVHGENGQAWVFIFQPLDQEFPERPGVLVGIRRDTKLNRPVLAVKEAADLRAELLALRAQLTEQGCNEAGYWCGPPLGPRRMEVARSVKARAMTRQIERVLGKHTGTAS